MTTWMLEWQRCTKLNREFEGSERKRSHISKRRKFMLHNYVFTLSVLSLLMMGQAVTAHAADNAAPSYPNWAAVVVPAYPHARPWSSPIAARVQSKMYGLVTTDQMPAVVAWYKYVNENLHAHHGMTIVPFCGHSQRCMFTSDASLPLMFSEVRPKCLAGEIRQLRPIRP